MIFYIISLLNNILLKYPLTSVSFGESVNNRLIPNSHKHKHDIRKNTNLHLYTHTHIYNELKLKKPNFLNRNFLNLNG